MTKMSPISEAIRLTKLWQGIGPNTYPMDIDQLIKEVLDESSFCGELRTRRKELDSIEGSLVRVNGTDRWKILLNSKTKNKRRQRFTHAHELGHYMCHKDLRDCFEDSTKTLNNFTDEIEAEANTFASWLLMPANLLRDEFSEVDWSIETLQRISNRFECSLQASAIRFIQLSKRPVAFIVSRDGFVNWCKKSKSAPYMTVYCHGDELPKNSAPAKNNSIISSRNSWSTKMTSLESHYLDNSGNDYQYTCIEFKL